MLTRIDPVTQTLATTNRLTASSYIAVDNNYLRVYDKYNDNYIYIPAASTTAGIMALTDFEYGPWWSPAGERRGEYVGVTNLAYSPNKAERDELYKKGVNPIVQFPGRGTILFGDKTKLASTICIRSYQRPTTVPCYREVSGRSCSQLPVRVQR